MLQNRLDIDGLDLACLSGNAMPHCSRNVGPLALALHKQQGSNEKVRGEEEKGHGKAALFQSLDLSSLRLSDRSEEHTSELQSLMRISYAVFCLNKKNTLDLTLTPHQDMNTHHNTQRK